MPVVTATVIGLYIADKIVEHFIQEEAGYKKFWHWLFPPETFRLRLAHIVDETVTEYSKSHPYDSSDRKFPFYQSQVFFDHMNKFVLFKKHSFKGLEDEMKKYPKLIKPTQKELDDFYSIFVTKIQKDKQAKKLFINENYKSQIYDVSQKIDELSTTVDSIKEDTSVSRQILEEQKRQQDKLKLNEQKVLTSLTAQINRQLERQVGSGKYLRHTFIETGIQKDLLRYLCDPIFFSSKCFSEIEMLDFRYLNKLLVKRKLSPFNFDLKEFKPALETLNISNIVSHIQNWELYLKDKKAELEGIMQAKGLSNDAWTFERKIGEREYLGYLRSKIALITEEAGQGKTNFICDFVDNFLTKRGIPVIFLTGTEINASDIRLSIIKKVFPDDQHHTFSELIEILKNYCHANGKHFIIIIDGINENLEPLSFSKSLEQFISELVEHDFIRFVVSCRTEYYQHNFANLEKSSFSNSMKRIQSLLDGRPDDKLKEKLLQVYLHHFEVKCEYIHDKAHNQLTSSFLLLRIFCEAYQKKNLGRVDNIYKEELFDKYFTLKAEEINSKIKDNDEFKVTGTFDIKNFIQNVVQYMITSKQFANVPIDDIAKGDRNRLMYVRFLDENILVRRDVQTNSAGLFESEVVNFTFDEFRDFLISRYLIDQVYKNSELDFSKFLDESMKEKSPILEGCSTFLFFIARRVSDSKLDSILIKQHWYNAVYSKQIFSVRDDLIKDSDKELIKSNLLTESGVSIVFNLMTRGDVETYKNLSIDFLFDILRNLNGEQYEKCFSDKFGDENWRYNKISQESLIHELDEIFEQDRVLEHPRFHKYFELLIYMFLNGDNWRIMSLYERYFNKHRDAWCGWYTDACEEKTFTLKLYRYIDTQ